MEDIVLTPEDILHMMDWSLNGLGLEPDELEPAMEKIRSSAQSPEELSAGIISLIFETYDEVVLKADEKIYGITGSKEDCLFDATDRKPHDDLGHGDAAFFD